MREAAILSGGISQHLNTAHNAMKSIAARNAFHPVREYLDNLQWDGAPRVDAWLTNYLGVEANNYTCAAGRCWLISAVARIMQPGCKAGAALLLIGPQGALANQPRAAFSASRGSRTICRI